MIQINDKKNCCGCKACYDICPKDAIKMKVDNEGFWYPEIDNDKCIDCHLCEKTCPELHYKELKKNEFETPQCYAAIHKNIEVRFGSTSGGIFSALAEKMYSQGGYVGGAIYDENFVVKHYISNNPSDLVRLRQSKYSQSDTEGFYKQVKELLVKGEKVLVCGTPCQMSGLRLFLGKEYENLIIVDFICKSITSPLFYSKYLEYWERKVGSKLVKVKFKDKEIGWRDLTKRFDFKNGTSIYSGKRNNDLSSAAYHKNAVSRPSCYDCKFKGFPRIADITVADFWGVEKYKELRGLDDNAGTSAVICNNSKGLEFFEGLTSVTKEKADIKQIIPGNPALLNAQKDPKIDRTSFFNDLHKYPIEDVIHKYKLDESDKIGYKTRIKHFILPIYHAWNYGNHSLWQMARFFYYNFLCNRIETNWMKEGVIYPTPYSIIDLKKGAKLKLDGPLVVGKKKVKKSKVETRLLIETGGYMYVKEYMRIEYGSDVEVFKNARFEVVRCGTNYGCTIICGKQIEFRGHVALGREVSIRDTNAHLIALQGYKVMRPVIIEDHVWLCSGATINAGVKIRSGAIVGANSYVTRNVPAHTLVSGSPAQVVEHDIQWKL